MAAYRSSPIFRNVIRCIVLLFASTAFTHAQVPSIKANVTSSNAQVGEAIRLEVEIANVKSASPPAVVVDGLEIRFRGESSQFRMVNGDVSRKQIYTYSVVASKEGSYTIPAIEIETDGQILKTQPITINIKGGAPVPGDVEDKVTADETVFAEIRIEKKELYVGESVPLEFRLYILKPARGQLTNNPQLTGEGFSVQPFKGAVERGMELAGKEYGVAQFMSLVTATKAGKLTLGPVTVPMMVQTVDKGQQRGVYDQIFGGSLGPVREVKVEAPAVEITVKPLPAEGRPPGFSGAIGKFEFEAAGSPGRIQAGQPVEMKLWIRGRGNFDRVDAPPPSDPDHWQAYPPGDTFEPTDRIGYSGTKIFTQNMVPKLMGTVMPRYEFSYFDPEQKQYITLTSKSQPLVIDGKIEPVVEKTATPAAAEKPEEVKPKEPDILGISPHAGNIASFALPMSYGKIFTLLFLPLPVVLIAVGWRFRKPNPEAARKKALREEIRGHMKVMQEAKEVSSVVDAAVHALQCHVSLVSGMPVAQIEEAQILGVHTLPGDLENKLRQLFVRRSELLYMGVGKGGVIIRSEREQLLELVAEFGRSVAR